jgi:hypothetical protein
MKYEKPEVVLLSSALTSVRHQNEKDESDFVDGAPLPCSIAAYAADE